MAKEPNLNHISNFCFASILQFPVLRARYKKILANHAQTSLAPENFLLSKRDTLDFQIFHGHLSSTQAQKPISNTVLLEGLIDAAHRSGEQAMSKMFGMTSALNRFVRKE